MEGGRRQEAAGRKEKAGGGKQPGGEHPSTVLRMRLCFVWQYQMISKPGPAFMRGNSTTTKQETGYLAPVFMPGYERALIEDERAGYEHPSTPFVPT